MDGAAVDFALTRLEAVDGARLEVEGTWSGVRGVRFVRPALVVRGEAGDERTLLADLEHKPWPALDGETWVAAFPWTGGEPDVSNTELAVAPSIVVPLAGGRARREAPAAARPRARPAGVEQPAAEPDRAPEAPRRARDEPVAERDRPAGTDRDAAPRDREAVRAELRRRDAALAARDEAIAARDAAVAERDAAIRERDALRRELREREQAAAGAARRREQALEERDAARRELADAEARAAERERRRAAARLEEMQAALGAAEAERDRALAAPAGVVAPPVRVRREHEAEAAHADWAARTAAILAVLVLLVLAITFLRAIA